MFAGTNTRGRRDRITVVPWRTGALACPPSPTGEGAYPPLELHMKRARLAIVLPASACRGETTPPPHPPAQSPLQHNEISATNLPKPFATESAGNPPRVFDP